MQGRVPQYCPLCTAKQKKTVKKSQRKQIPIPCEEHGHPIWTYNEYEELFQVYRMIQPYHVRIEYQDGKKWKIAFYLNVMVLKIFCEAMSLNFLETFDFLQSIHQGADGAKNPENQRGNL